MSRVYLKKEINAIRAACEASAVVVSRFRSTAQLINAPRNSLRLCRIISM
jgi:hypothetical protein